MKTKGSPVASSSVGCTPPREDHGQSQAPPNELRRVRDTAVREQRLQGDRRRHQLLALPARREWIVAVAAALPDLAVLLVDDEFGVVSPGQAAALVNRGRLGGVRS